MRPRPIDQVASARAVVAIVGLRAALNARARAARGAVARIWQALAPWFAAVAIVLAHGWATAWLDARESAERAAAAERELADLRAENADLAARLAEYAAGNPKRNVLYLIECPSIECAIGKLERAWLSLAQTQHDLMDARARR